MALAGVCSSALSTTEQPAAIAEASLRTGKLTGKFQGVKAATGPTGTRVTVWLKMPGTRGATVRPYRRLPSSA